MSDPRLLEKIRTLDDATIRASLEEIGPGVVDVDRMMVRAAMIDVYQERHGEDAADDLMDEIGM